MLSLIIKVFPFLTLICFNLINSKRVICDADCTNFSDLCLSALCSSEWAEKNCKAECDKCTPCESFPVTKSILPNSVDPAVNQTDKLGVNYDKLWFNWRLMNLHIPEMYSRLKTVKHLAARISGLSASSGKSPAVITNGQAKHLFDHDEGTCATIGYGNGEVYNDQFWFEFPKIRVHHFAVRVRRFDNEMDETSGSFWIKLYNGNHYGCGLMNGQFAGWHVSMCPQHLPFSKAFLSIWWLKTLEVCSIDLYGIEDTN